jgi:hypothetical protein
MQNPLRVWEWICLFAIFGSGPVFVVAHYFWHHGSNRSKEPEPVAVIPEIGFDEGPKLRLVRSVAVGKEEVRVKAPGGVVDIEIVSDTAAVEAHTVQPIWVWTPVENPVLSAIISSSPSAGL